MTQTPIKATQAGEYIKRKADAARIYIRGAYDRSAKAYACTAADDINQVIYIKATTPVYIGFTY
jgi:hypothetical protein